MIYPRVFTLLLSYEVSGHTNLTTIDINNYYN